MQHKPLYSLSRSSPIRVSHDKRHVKRRLIEAVVVEVAAVVIERFPVVRCKNDQGILPLPQFIEAVQNGLNASVLISPGALILGDGVVGVLDSWRHRGEVEVPEIREIADG